MSVFKDLKSIAESANNELISQIDSENDGLAKAIADEFNQIETLEKDVFEYNAPMVPVIQKDLNEGAKYIVEFDMLNKYATDGGIDIVTAYNNVCESNNIPSDDMYVYLRGSITECCTRPEAFEPETLRNSLKAMRSLSENGINLLREEALNESKKNDSKDQSITFRGATIEVDSNSMDKFNTDIRKYSSIVKKILSKYDDAFKQAWEDNKEADDAKSFKEWKTNIKVSSGRIIIFNNDVVTVEFSHKSNKNILGPMHYLTITISCKDDKYNYESTIDG
jgi:hypothetical protein